MPPHASARPWIAAVFALATIALALGGAILGRRRVPRAEEGAALFRVRCALCHATSGAGARGPGLGGVVGRHAAAMPGFGYSRALRDSGLVWDAPTLDRFLRQPSALVPGTSMPASVPDPRDRAALVAYLAAVPGEGADSGAPPEAEVRSGGGEGDPAARRASAAWSSTFGDYHTDSPGRRHRVPAAGLPPPYATPSASNPPGVADRPPGARPVLPADFIVDRLALDLDGPRRLRIAPNGDVFVAESAAGRVRVLRLAGGAAAPERNEVFASGLDVPFGLAFYPSGPDPRWLYVAQSNAIVRFAYRAGDLHASGDPETIVARLSDTSGGHTTRDIAFSPDGTRLFVAVGSASNVAQGERPKPLAEAAAWDRAHAVGAAWGSEADRADVLVFDPEGRGERIWAAGIRNCVGLTFAPSGGDPWCATNERDGLGDDLVPDYATPVREHAFYGWPWYYLGAHPDPRHAGERPDLADRVTLPDVLFPAHSAALQIAFYDGAMFPAQYRGDAFVTFHGSWNRSVRTGPKVVRVLFHDGVPTGEYEDFMTGFVVDDARVWGRPVGVAVAQDGALLVSDDAGGAIWRVTAR